MMGNRLRQAADLPPTRFGVDWMPEIPKRSVFETQVISK
jgi:hypothetical protein